MSELHKNYYAIIPANVRYDKELKANEKLLFGELTALANEKGYCWATNNYFAELYDTKKETVSRWISHLEKKGYITTQLVYRGKEIIERRIYINNTPIDKKINTSCENNHYPNDKKINTPIDEKVKDNNTIINNTINNTHTIEKTVCVEELTVKIETAVGQKTSETVVKNLLKKSDIETINEYISNWSKYKDFAQDEKNPLSWFIHCVSVKRPIPLLRNNTKNSNIPQYANFEQREYSEDYYEKFYANLDS
jgi:DNA-binding MarR family transcriptional regulator